MCENTCPLFQKVITIPRLELQVAHLSTVLMNCVLRTLDINFNKLYHFSDYYRIELAKNLRRQFKNIRVKQSTKDPRPVKYFRLL